MLSKSRVSSKLPDTNQHLVKIRWTIYGEYNPWNEACAWAIEIFGLPGSSGRYECTPTPSSMNFYFRDLADAVLFELRWG